MASVTGTAKYAGQCCALHGFGESPPDPPMRRPAREPSRGHFTAQVHRRRPPLPSGIGMPCVVSGPRLGRVDGAARPRSGGAWGLLFGVWVRLPVSPCGRDPSPPRTSAMRGARRLLGTPLGGARRQRPPCGQCRPASRAWPGGPPTGWARLVSHGARGHHRGLRGAFRARPPQAIFAGGPVVEVSPAEAAQPRATSVNG
jgi:hypothetical protein